MGKKDVAAKIFFEDNSRFADVVNAGIFYGKKILLADKLENANGYSDTLLGSSTERSKKTALYKFRDIVQKSMYGTNFALIGIENQWNIHYAMPVRIMGYDFLTYDTQLKEFKKIHKREKDLSGNEYLSGFSKEDLLFPAVTMLIYYGKEPWDGPRSLFEMINWKQM